MTAFDLSLVDRLSVPASLHDVDGRFLHLNAAGERASGFSSEKMRGRRSSIRCRRRRARP